MKPKIKFKMTVQRRVKEIAKRFKACDYFFMNWAQLNKMADVVHRPIICYILPPSGTLKPRFGCTQFIDKPLTAIAFLARTDIDFNGERNDDVVENMKTLAKLFIQKMEQSGYFTPLDETEIEYQVPYDKLDDCLTGIIAILPLELTETIGCETEFDFGYTESNE